MADARSNSHTPTGGTAGEAQTAGSPRSAEMEATEVIRSIRRIIRAVDIHSKRIGRTVGLTVPQIVVLSGIRDLGEVTTGKLSAHAHLSPATVTTILDNLESRNLVERVRSIADRRVVHPRLTESGLALLEAAPPLLQNAFMTAFADLPPDESGRIVSAFARVAEMMDAPEPNAPPVLDIGAMPD